VLLDGPGIFQSHDATLVLLALAIAALGSFVTCFLFAQAREMQGQGRFGWVFLAGFAVAAVMWTTYFVALLAFQPGIEIAYNPKLVGSAFFLAVIIATVGLAIAAFGGTGAAFVGGAMVGLAAVAVHLSAATSMRIQGTIEVSPLLVWTSMLLAAFCGALALGRARVEGRNVQFIAPMFLAAGICIVHFIGVVGMQIAIDPRVAIPTGTIAPPILGSFVTAMAMLLFGTGLATTLIARGARLQAQTQLRNIADASMEGLILTDGATIPGFQRERRGLVGARRARGCAIARSGTSGLSRHSHA
jgi:NO-binding membrane sensor protein with MHYT domain